MNSSKWEKVHSAYPNRAAMRNGEFELVTSYLLKHDKGIWCGYFKGHEVMVTTHCKFEQAVKEFHRFVRDIHAAWNAKETI